MNLYAPFIAEGVLILAAGTFGVLLDRRGRPFGRVKLVVHLFLAAWFATGFVFIVLGLGTLAIAAVTWVPVTVMGLAILTQLVTGIVMLATGKRGRTFAAIHLSSAIVMLASDACAFFLARLRA